MTLIEQQLEAVLNAIDGVDVSDRPSIGQAMQDAKNATLKALAGAEKERPRPRLVKNPKEQPKPEPKRATKRERKRAAAVRRAVAAQPSGVARAPEPERRVARAVLIQPFIRRILAPFLEPVRAPEPKPKRAAVAQPKPKRAAVAQPKPKRAAVAQRVPWIDLPLARWANRHKVAPPKKLAAMPDREAGAAHEAEAAPRHKVAAPPKRAGMRKPVPPTKPKPLPRKLPEGWTDQTQVGTWWSGGE